MPEDLDQRPTTAHSTMPGAEILRETRGLLLAALGAALVYSFVTHASKGSCPGGVTADGGFLDRDGLPTEVPPQCIELTLQPSFLVYVAIGFIVLSAISRVLRFAETEAAAIRTLDRAGVLIIALAGASVLIGQIWFWMLPIDDWTGSVTLFLPFPFADVDVQMSPMVRG